MAEINTEVVESEELLLPPNHPGRGDVDYLRRRRMFFFLARDHRLRGLSAPSLEYTVAERALWESTYHKLVVLHQRYAATLFLEGKQRLGLTSEEIPQLQVLTNPLVRRTGVRLVPAEGLLHGKIYFEYWAQRIMPCTQFLRFHLQPEYTPEPDIIHDVVGHVPPLMDPDYVGLIERIGLAARHASPERLERIVRFYWFTVEFGLLRERGETKILGAGILSSIKEIQHVLSGEAELREFDFEEVVSRPFQTSDLQPVLYVVPSIAEIARCAERL